jgi:hypothetical protein
VNVVVDTAGPISISFDSPTDSFRGYFTYLVPIILQAFDVADDQVDIVASSFSKNVALSGDAGSSPNELLELTFPSGISRVLISGDVAGASFVLDDMAFAPVPEPGALWLTILGGLALIIRHPLRSAATLCLRAHVPTLIPLLFCVLASLNLAFAVPSVDNVAASPSVISVDATTEVTVTAQISDESVIPASINLFQIDASGRTLAFLGILRDDGTNGDSTPGDQTFALRLPFSVSTPGDIRLRISAAFRGVLRRVFSQIVILTVRSGTPAELTLITLAAEISSGNISAALKRFSASPLNRETLLALDTSGRAKLSAALQSAKFVRQIDNLRIYELLWTEINGTSRHIHISLSELRSGEWVVSSW